MFVLSLSPMLSFTEENYLKALLRLNLHGGKAEAGTNELAALLGVKPATATDMLKKLKEKKLIDYEKYGKIRLTKAGRSSAIEVLRKHRLWETFLYDKLDFTWDEVHEVAEQLEHIQSAKLIERLDKFLGYPQADPHGDPIPRASGEIPSVPRVLLSEVKEGESCQVAAVKDSSTIFLQYLRQLSITIGTKLKVIEKIPYDGSMSIQIGKSEKATVSQKFAESLLVV
jgi:DtxR family transcriptional regulator, Mn-dependent transcriptional regulator